MRLSLKRGAAVIAVIAALGASIFAIAPTATADEADAPRFAAEGGITTTPSSS